MKCALSVTSSQIRCTAAIKMSFGRSNLNEKKCAISPTKQKSSANIC